MSWSSPGRGEVGFFVKFHGNDSFFTWKHSLSVYPCRKSCFSSADIAIEFYNLRLWLLEELLRNPKTKDLPPMSVFFPSLISLQLRFFFSLLIFPLVFVLKRRRAITVLRLLEVKAPRRWSLKKGEYDIALNPVRIINKRPKKSKGKRRDNDQTIAWKLIRFFSLAKCEKTDRRGMKSLCCCCAAKAARRWRLCTVGGGDEHLNMVACAARGCQRKKLSEKIAKLRV